MFIKSRKTLVAFLLLPFILIVKLTASFPGFVEQFYSNTIYVYTSKLLRFTIGWLPFSFGDLFYIFSVIYITRWLIINRKRVIKDTKNWCIDVFSAVSIVYIAFHLFWGMNYYRLPLHKSLNIESSYTTEALVEISQELILKSNAAHNRLAENDSTKITFPFSKEDIIKKTPEGYIVLRKQFPHLDYTPKSLKKSLLSLPLTYMGFSGYLNPLTNEAQVNALIPAYKFPTTAAHEAAHQLGYAAENEANFIGFLATINNDDPYFKYSGYTFGLRYCLREIYKRDPERYDEILKTINPGILKNYEEVRLFWDSYQNPTEPLFKKSYNTFLQANNQKGGMESYSYVVALIVNYFDKNTL